MYSSTDLLTRAGEQLLRWRWPLVALAGLFNILVETLEDGLGFHTGMDAFYWAEVLLFGVLGPLCGGVALTLVAHSRQGQQRANRYLSQHKDLVSRLASAHDWPDLTALVVRFPRAVADVRGTCLLVHDPSRGQYHLEDQWWDLNELIPARLTVRCDSHRCATCTPLLAGGTPAGPRQAAFSERILPAPCAEQGTDSAVGDRYCLPLAYGSEPIGLIYLFLPPGGSLAHDQGEALSAMAASVAAAMHEAQPQRAAIIQAIAADAERQRIARDLHDTLGQSIGYLRLKLDQLTGDDPLTEIRVIRQELEQMRAVAGEAYLHVRRTISELHASPPVDLAVALEQQGSQAAGRAGFTFNLACEGVPCPLPPHTQRQVLHLLGEALNNVEKHAAASQVEMRLAWTDDSLEIRCADDGRGFEPGALRSDGHFGLGIMQQRALAIHGELAIHSAPGLGTQLLLRLPIAAGPQAVGGET